MAVYTEVADEDLANFLAGYDAGDLLSYKGIAEGVENTNFVVHTTRGQYILTLYEKRVLRQDLPYFLNLKEHLARAGLMCPVPIRDRRGRALNELSGRAAALISFLEGFWVRRPKVEHCAAVGRALAELHRAGGDFPMRRENALGRSAWRPLFEKFAPRAGEIARGLGATIEEELRLAEQSWPAGLPEGVIHADLFPDNVFFLGDRLSGLIDFYFACNDALAYDIAIALNAWCFEPDYSFNVTKGRALLRGYGDIRPLAAAEREAMPALARGAALRFLLTRSHDWLITAKNALVKPHDPLAYLRRLRFHQTVRAVSDYGYENR
jgi:homoserine kinase type II